MIENDSNVEVRQFRAADKQTALGLVHREWGPGATVVQSRTIWDGWWRGLWGARSVEVTAVRYAPRDSRERDRETTHAARPIAVAESPLPDYSQDFRERFRRKVASFRDAPGRQPASRHGSTSDSDNIDVRLFATLLDQQLDEDLARQTLGLLRSSRGDGAADDATVRQQALQSMFASQIRTRLGFNLAPGRPNIVAFVGPTGVGKTTTIAKIAANYRLREKRNVGLISTDMYRIAAVDQLRTYAEIIDLPLEIAATPREMRQAVSRLAECDLILVDTAGRSPRAALQLQELKVLLQAAETHETILVLSATCNGWHLSRIAQQFAPVDCSSLILTKLDESHGPGGSWSFLSQCHLPLRYITNGQSVPEDIRDADAEQLAAMLFESSEC